MSEGRASAKAHVRHADVKPGPARRTIDLDERTVEVLRAWRTEREREAALIGATVSEDETVFARPDGELTHPDYFSQVFDRHCAGSELPRIRFHDLRHTHGVRARRGAGER